MQASFKILAAVAILITVTFEVSEVQAADINFQELRSRIAMPVLPEKIRYRNSKRGSTRITYQPKEFPRRMQKDENNQPVYVQRQPKQPPKVYVVRRPTAYPGQRGSMPPKSFGPPRARYVH